MSNVVSSREFWDRKVDNVLTRFYYNGDRKELVDNLTRLGYNEDKINGILDEWEEGEDG